MDGIVSTDVLVIGGGMVAHRLLSRLAEFNFDRPLTLVSEEDIVGYNRVLLPEYLAGNSPLNDLIPERVNPRFDIRCGVRAQSVDLANRRVELADGATIQFNTLIFATGSTVPLPELTDPDQMTQLKQLRRLIDADALNKECATTRNAIVIGGGLLGLETAHALIKRGLKVRVVHRGNYLMNRQLDPEGGFLLQRTLETLGFEFSLGRQLRSIEMKPGGDRHARLDDTSRYPADLIVCATGAKANDQLARDAGLPCRKGIVVDSLLQTSVPSVYALGECASVCGQHYSLVDPVFKQAEQLARHLCGRAAGFIAPAPSTRLKISGTQLFAAGVIEAPTSLSRQLLRGKQASKNTGDLILRDRSVYRRLSFRGDQLRGAVLIGDTIGARRIHQHIGRSVPRTIDRENLAFGL